MRWPVLAPRANAVMAPAAMTAARTQITVRRRRSWFCVLFMVFSSVGPIGSIAPVRVVPRHGSGISEDLLLASTTAAGTLQRHPVIRSPAAGHTCFVGRGTRLDRGSSPVGCGRHTVDPVAGAPPGIREDDHDAHVAGASISASPCPVGAGERRGGRAAVAGPLPMRRLQPQTDAGCPRHGGANVDDRGGVAIMALRTTCRRRGRPRLRG